MSSHGRSKQRRATITLEWIVLVTVIIIGSLAAVAAVRNSLLEEYREILDTICQMSVGE
jgi:hypothetical protein